MQQLYKEGGFMCAKWMTIFLAVTTCVKRFVIIANQFYFKQNISDMDIGLDPFIGGILNFCFVEAFNLFGLFKDSGGSIKAELFEINALHSNHRMRLRKPCFRFIDLLVDKHFIQMKKCGGFMAANFPHVIRALASG